MTRCEDIKHFYDILAGLESDLGGLHRLADCDGRMDWPVRGVYFFFESGEERSDTGGGLRVTRVGTHALTKKSGTTLWNRLAQHRGVSSTGAGNHRGSIFRLLVGQAFKRYDNVTSPVSWGVGGDPGAAARKLGMTREEVKAEEFELECKVSRYIRSMPFLWLGIDDPPGGESKRGIIERNSIALLSNFGKDSCDPSSDDWLGSNSDRERVCLSGLWNNNHVDEKYDPQFLGLFELLIKQQHDRQI